MHKNIESLFYDVTIDFFEKNTDNKNNGVGNKILSTLLTNRSGSRATIKNRRKTNEEIDRSVSGTGDGSGHDRMRRFLGTCCT